MTILHQMLAQKTQFPHAPDRLVQVIATAAWLNVRPSVLVETVSGSRKPHFVGLCGVSLQVYYIETDYRFVVLS